MKELRDLRDVHVTKIEDLFIHLELAHLRVIGLIRHNQKGRR